MTVSEYRKANPPVKYTAPTRACLFCEKLENPDANLVNGGAWLCPECKEKIRKLIQTV